MVGYMTDFLVYWKGFWADTDGDLTDLDEGWYTKNEPFFRAVAPGDVLWVVVHGGAGARDEWRLLQRVVVKNHDPMRSRSKYGPHHLIPDTHRSAVYDPRVQGDFARTLRRLAFATGKA